MVSYVDTNLPVNVIATLPHPRSGDSQGQETSLAPSDDNKTRNYDTSSYHCKKGIPKSQALRLNRICSDNEGFVKHCNDLKGWLMEKECNGKMIRK